MQRVGYAASGLSKSWGLRSDHHSPRYTTSWKELLRRADPVSGCPQLPAGEGEFPRGWVSTSSTHQDYKDARG
ncbi:DUF4113 domain-containing protein [Rhizobium leguminosarum]|uniref:DUF4113 domain-containing protein n=1 Tax=Rhizobium leguminosarum TaxID=384 RepID=UPI001441BAF6|nr:DUF4113 domain-containing protein [Rhizobium leguminosarum bv. viciae]